MPFFASPWSAAALEALSDRTPKFMQAIENLSRAMRRFGEARAACHAAAQADLAVLIAKTDAYRRHLRTLCMLPEIFARTGLAFTELDAQGATACRERLRETSLLAHQAEENATDAAKRFGRLRQPPHRVGVCVDAEPCTHRCPRAPTIHRQCTRLLLRTAVLEPRRLATALRRQSFPTHQIEGADTLVLG